MTAKTSTEKARTLREKRAREGLAEVRGVWAPPARHKDIKAMAKQLIESGTHGCHCDLEDCQAPDGCVFDENRIEDCVYARKLHREGKGRNDCKEWRPIEFVAQRMRKEGKTK